MEIIAIGLIVGVFGVGAYIASGSKKEKEPKIKPQGSDNQPPPPKK